MQEKSLIKKNILQFIEYKGITKYRFYQETGIMRGVLDQNNGMSEENTAKFLAYFPEVSSEWLLTGKGDMLKSADNSRKKIPVYPANTIGGTNELQASMDSISEPSEWIDAGDWFVEATSAIHHYGDSMLEYPSGCILALKDIMDKEKVVWGKNYVIETSEYRITKRMQRGKSEGFVRAYSTNCETYPDGTLIHEPIDILGSDILRLALVLGYVVKEQSSGMIYRVKK